MILKLEFKEFQKKIVQNSPVFPTVHYCEMEDVITMTFMSGEGWKYYTIITHEDIQNFANGDSIEFEEAYEMFFVNYLSNALKTEPQHKNELYLVDMEEETEEYFQTQNSHKSPINHPLVRSVEILSGNDIVKEARDYSEFLLMLFNSFEKRVLSSVDDINLSKDFMAKSFGDFLKNLFNTVNTVAFGNHIKRYLRNDLIRGLESAENELNVDIGYTKEYENKLAQLQNQQLTGYTINGKKWVGIKGVTKELQQSIIQIVQEGISAGKTSKEIKTDISSKFDSFSDWRSNMIARTETNRVINEGRLLGYKESGLKGKKVWATAPYEPTRSSDICQRLKNQTVDLDADFIDPDTLKAFGTPPAHPNCRSRIIFRPD